MTHVLLTRRRVLGSALAVALPLRAAARSAEDWVVPEEFLSRPVSFRDEQEVGAIIVDPDYFELYWVTAPNEGVLFRVGVGRGERYEAGRFTVGAKKEWPSWTPTDEMIAREPDLYAKYADGMPGGPDNPLGARALYLFDDFGNDTYLRIHGTPEPWTIGSAVSNGCVRLVNEDIEALYDAVALGAPVVLLPKVELA